MFPRVVPLILPFVVLLTVNVGNAAPSVRPFQLESGGGAIAGEVDTAGDQVPETAVIVIGGSSYRTRADAAAALPWFLAPDVAVVLFDRRGSGASTGRFDVPTTENTAWLVPALAEDTVAVAAALKDQGFRRVGLIGTSMGGWINVAAAARSRAIDFIVCISGGASTVGVSDAYDELVAKGFGLAEAAKRARAYDGPQGYDPRPDLATLTQPALWIFGELDRSNPTALDTETVRAMQTRGKNFRLLTLPGTNHELVDENTGKFNDSWIEPTRSFIRTH